MRSGAPRDASAFFPEGPSGGTQREEDCGRGWTKRPSAFCSRMGPLGCVDGAFGAGVHFGVFAQPARKLDVGRTANDAFGLL